MQREFFNRQRIIHKSTIALWCCFALIVGICIALYHTPPFDVIFAILFVSLVALIITRQSFARTVFWVTLFFAIGVWRVYVLPTYENNPYNQQARFTGIVIREPDIQHDEQRIVVRAANIEGDIQFTAQLQTAFQIGEVLDITCTLSKPEPGDDFRYDRYLQRYGISSLCEYPRIESLGRQSGWRTVLFGFKQYLMLAIQRTMPSPEHTIILGAVFGVNHALPPHIAEQFRVTGTMHLLVISGSNIVILSGVLLAAMRRLPLSKRTAICIIIAVLFVYALFTGWQPPAVRATIFGSISLMASLIGRPSHALRLLLLVATQMLCFNPLLALYDAGFQLSFLATAGIILFSKPFERWLKFIPQAFTLRSATAVTLSAMLTTSPLIAYSFESFSVIALPANLVIGPLMEFILLAGVASVSLSAVLPAFIASWLNVPVYIIIHITLQLVEWFAEVPYASVQLPPMQLWMLGVQYAAIGAFALYIQKNYEQHN